MPCRAFHALQNPYKNFQKKFHKGFKIEEQSEEVATQKPSKKRNNVIFNTKSIFYRN
jgi:hypothetical protein